MRYWLIIAVGYLAMTINSSQLFAGNKSEPVVITSDLEVYKIRIGRHTDKTRIVLDLNGWAEFSYKVDRTGKMVFLDLPGVKWRAGPANQSNVGMVKGYSFNKQSKDLGRLGIAVDGPVKIKAAFRLPPAGKKGHRIVLDLIADKPKKITNNSGLVSLDKARLIQEVGGLTQQDKAINSSFAPSTPLAILTPVRATVVPDLTKSASCPPFPNIPWWENNTHSEAAQYVYAKYNGDWKAYVIKWKNHLDKVANAFVDQKKILIKSANITLQGDDYINYINYIEDRISIIRCLARADFLARN